MEFIRGNIVDSLDSLERDIKLVLEEVIEAQKIADCDPVLDSLYDIEDQLSRIVRTLR